MKQGKSQNASHPNLWLAELVLIVLIAIIIAML
jgi:hypothetical protein